MHVSGFTRMNSLCFCINCSESVSFLSQHSLARFLLCHFFSVLSFLCFVLGPYMIDLNDGGKVLLSERFKPIPLSVWPVVLERVNQRKGYYGSTNVLYHLLRNGPAIGKRYKTVKSKASDFVPTPMTVAAAPITTIVDYYNHTQDNIDTPVIGIAPVVHFPNSSTMVVTPTTPPAMVTSRKRKISMP